MTDGGSKTCFVIMPITVPAHLEQRYGRDDHFTKIYEVMIAPAVRAAGLEPGNPKRTGTENIHAGIINDLQGADLVLADLSALNPNVFLELGIRSALDKPVCLVWDGLDTLPFDSGTLNTHRYDPLPLYGLNDEIGTMAEHIRATVEKSDGRNELWKFFGTAAALPAAQLQPEDASLASKLDRLTELVENRLVAPAPQPGVLKSDDVAGLVARLTAHFENAGSRGIHGTRVQNLCRLYLDEAYPAFTAMGGPLSSRLRSLGLDIRANDHGQFFLGPEPDPQ